MTRVPDESVQEAARALELFRLDLVALRRSLGGPSFETMAGRIRHARGVSGSKNTLNGLVKGPLLKPPSPELLLGFLKSLNVADADTAGWIARRERLAKLCDYGGKSWDQPAPITVRDRLLGSRAGWIVAAMVVVIALAVLVVGLMRNTSRTYYANVRGTVQCSSGATVMGVFVDDGTKEESHFAAFRANRSPSSASYAARVVRDRQYSLHVGCGGSRSSWRIDSRSPFLSPADYDLVCEDQVALNAGEQYGRCVVR